MHRLLNTVSILIMLIVYTNSYAQTTLYGIKNSRQSYQFISIDCNTDSITVLNDIPIDHYGMYFSSCFDPLNQKYYYSTGQIVYKIDAPTGVIEDTFNFSSINPHYLNSIVYNPVNGLIYGIRHNIVTQANYISYYDPLFNFVFDAGILPFEIHSSNTAKSSIDAERQLYIIQSATLTGIDLVTGQIVFHDSIPSVNNQSFDHIAYSCKTGQVYGLHNHPLVFNAYFGTIDTSANITPINSAALPVFYHKMTQSGSTIDNNTDTYYYAGLQGKLYGIDIHTGNLVYAHDYGPGFEFLFLESASDYACPIAGVVEEDAESALNLFPNPALDEITFTYPLLTSAARLTICDLAGKELLNIELSANSDRKQITAASFAPGIYLARLQSDQLHAPVKFIISGKD
jgi:hypothetical protein